jgi:hypothetical protein
VIPAEARDEISASNRCPTVSANEGLSDPLCKGGGLT